MDWNDLRHFLALAQTGQLTRAGTRLGVDATTVGRRVRRLEVTLQQTLFEQAREGQVLTEAGEQLLVLAEQVEQAMHRIQDAHPGDGLAGTIRLSVSEGFGTWIVAHRLMAFLKLHPRVQVDLVASSGFLNPSRREADIAVLLARPRSGPLISRKLADYALGIYAARSYLESVPRMPSDRSELSEHPLIGYIPDFIYAPELNYLDEISPGLRPKIRSSSINAQYRLATAGAGIAILPCFIGGGDSRLTRLLPELSIRRSFWLVTHQDTRQLARIQAFGAWLAELAHLERSRLLGLESEPPA
ncbi:LysR family transcriptional regulator [Sphingosinicella terrae]|uniref:LysR family transcriptional regulator n=1 Tax=Sphingosinicella terrae TaxID=2172047 RepID=UPI000E0D349F|nr:LysR family transcriptional regulator [Sphingosinicella terrae]